MNKIRSFVDEDLSVSRVHASYKARTQRDCEEKTKWLWSDFSTCRGNGVPEDRPAAPLFSSDLRLSPENNTEAPRLMADEAFSLLQFFLSLKEILMQQNKYWQAAFVNNMYVLNHLQTRQYRVFAHYQTHMPII